MEKDEEKQKEIEKEQQNSQSIQKSKIAENEEKILEFWEKNKIFQKTLEKPSSKGNFVFYDGPPFATGEPHYGHIVPGTIKDIIPRYKTMKGYHVRRRWGWDCHGLPVENLVEKELKLSSRKDIIDYGIGNFNQNAEKSVMRYADSWRKIIPRLGRWVDMDNDYKTMDSSYTESVWWAFSELYKKGLIYEGFKSMNLCPHCETTLSNFEVSQGYKDITDISVTVEFKLIDEKENIPTYFLAWTTTPWTLPGNVALAINPKVEYIKVQIKKINIDNTEIAENFIFAKSRLSILKTEYNVIEEIKGEDLIGKSYEPVFDYYKNDKKLKNSENGWKVYGADFVTTEDGTGIVHIAPAFGADDYDLSLKFNLPFIQHVGTNGKFKDDFAKMTNDESFKEQDVKPKDTEEDKVNKIETHQRADIEIIKYLAKNNTIFAKEKLIHSYPHCYRCDTPLLNYACSSWFVKVTAIRDKLVNANKKVKWIPAEIGEGRFGNWLSGARDWAISRSRFWGAPLPVWIEESSSNNNLNDEVKDKKIDKKESYDKKYIVISSIEDLKKYSKAKNTYYIMRHGEAENNTKMIISSKPENPHHLTDKGKVQVEEASKWLKDKKIDLIISSPFIRTKETAEIVAKKLNFEKDKIIFESKIGELNAGIWNGKPFIDFTKTFANTDRFTKTPEGGENYTDIKKRVGDFIYDLENKYKDKNILIITHDTPFFLLETVARGLNVEQSNIFHSNSDHYVENAKVIKLDFYPLPHNSEYELDLHRPFIDDIELVSENGNKLKRIPEVFDCWFESGSMPFGEAHYPFNKTDFNPKPGPFSKILGKTKGYPADFIAEGQDQTRGWFYSMIVLGIALFNKSPFKRVVVNGMVLAEDGQKMSKSKKNYPDLMFIVNKYGSDALRYYLMSSPVVHAEDFCFSEKGVDEVVKKHIGRLNNVLTFFEMYAKNEMVESKNKDENIEDKENKNIKSEEKKVDKKIISNNLLDKWILARLAELIKEITENLEKYEIDRAIRPFADFIDDLSVWYLRRSRDRFKVENLSEPQSENNKDNSKKELNEKVKDKEMALSTMRFILIELSKLLAPFMPFLAEDIYLRLKGNDNEMKESVHLESWPKIEKVDKKIIESMVEIRKVASLGLEARMKAKINVRQPLPKLSLRNSIPIEFVYLIKDEVNVKEIVFDKNLSEEIVLDTNISAELKEEGMVREIMRAIQDLRKQKGLTIQDKIILIIDGDKAITDLISKNKSTISNSTLLKDIMFKSLEVEFIKIGDFSIKMSIEK